jgi:hypothetical protein
MKKYWVIILTLIVILCASAVALPPPPLRPPSTGGYTPAPRPPVLPLNNAPIPVIPNWLLQQNDIVAMTILGEARGEGHAGMYAVACVIAQRSNAWRKTPYQICLQPKQFSCWNNPAMRQTLAGLLRTPEGLYAKTLANNLMYLQRAYVGFADHYHSRRIMPYWARGKKPVKIIGNHIFYKLR